MPLLSCRCICTEAQSLTWPLGIRRGDQIFDYVITIEKYLKINYLNT